jgi:hypothetical protein
MPRSMMKSLGIFLSNAVLPASQINLVNQVRNGVPFLAAFLGRNFDDALSLLGPIPHSQQPVSIILVHLNVISRALPQPAVDTRVRVECVD